MQTSIALPFRAQPIVTRSVSNDKRSPINALTHVDAPLLLSSFSYPQKAVPLAFSMILAFHSMPGELH